MTRRLGLIVTDASPFYDPETGRVDHEVWYKDGLWIPSPSPPHNNRLNPPQSSIEWMSDITVAHPSKNRACEFPSTRLKPFKGLSYWTRKRPTYGPQGTFSIVGHRDWRRPGPLRTAGF